MFDTKLIENKSAVKIHGLKPGAKLKIRVDRDGIAMDLNWRRRLRDNDGNIVIVEHGKVTETVKTKSIFKKEEV